VASGDEGALARALDFQRQSMALVGAELTRIPEGWVARTPSLPLVWGFNHVAVTVPITAADARALAERHLGDLPYRQVVVEDPGGEAVAGALHAEGWRVDRNIGMVLDRDPDRELDTSMVIEAPEGAALELMRDWIGEEEEVRRDPRVHAQAVESCRLIWQARRAQRLGVLGRDGALAGITMLYSDGVVAQVEDVYVVPSERGRGLGRALVTHAAVLAVDAGHEFVFIFGDDEDWPPQLYRAVGFEPVGRTWVFDRSAS